MKEALVWSDRAFHAAHTPSQQELTLPLPSKLRRSRPDPSEAGPRPDQTGTGTAAGSGRTGGRTIEVIHVVRYVAGRGSDDVTSSSVS